MPQGHDVKVRRRCYEVKIVHFQIRLENGWCGRHPALAKRRRRKTSDGLSVLYVLLCVGWLLDIATIYIMCAHTDFVEGSRRKNGLH